MPEYLATARRPNGRRVTEKVEAASADEVVSILRDRGCDEIVLHDDDVTAVASSRSAACSPGLRVLLRKRPLVGSFLVATLAGYRMMWFIAMLFALWAVYAFYAGFHWEASVWWCVATLLFPPALGLALVPVAASVLSRELRMWDALSWGRWEECLRRVNQTGTKVSPHVIARCKAGALAGMGRLDEALQILKPFGDGRAVPEWYYRGMLADAYNAVDLRLRGQLEVRGQAGADRSIQTEHEDPAHPRAPRQGAQAIWLVVAGPNRAAMEEETMGPLP